MKLNEVLKLIVDKGNIQDSNFETVLAASTLKDIEVPDSFMVNFNNNYFTKDRALNDVSLVGELQKKSNKSVFDAMDAKMNDGFLSLIAPEDAQKIKETKETFEKYDLYKAAINKAFETTKEATKGKVNTDANKILEEKTKEINDLHIKYKGELKELDQRLNDNFIENTLKTKVLGYNFADAYKPLKTSIADLAVNNVRKNYKVSLDKGELKLLKQVDGSDSFVEAFEGNEKLTVDKLLEKELKQFVAVSNAAEQKEKKDTYIPEAGAMANMTLAQIRATQANGVHSLP